MSTSAGGLGRLPSFIWPHRIGATAALAMLVIGAGVWALVPRGANFGIPGAWPALEVGIGPYLTLIGIAMGLGGAEAAPLRRWLATACGGATAALAALAAAAALPGTAAAMLASVHPARLPAAWALAMAVMALAAIEPNWRRLPLPPLALAGALLLPIALSCVHIGEVAALADLMFVPGYAATAVTGLIAAVGVLVACAGLLLRAGHFADSAAMAGRRPAWAPAVAALTGLIVVVVAAGVASRAGMVKLSAQQHRLSKEQNLAVAANALIDEFRAGPAAAARPASDATAAVETTRTAPTADLRLADGRTRLVWSGAAGWLETNGAGSESPALRWPSRALARLLRPTPRAPNAVTRLCEWGVAQPRCLVTREGAVGLQMLQGDETPLPLVEPRSRLLRGADGGPELAVQLPIPALGLWVEKRVPLAPGVTESLADLRGMAWLILGLALIGGWAASRLVRPLVGQLEETRGRLQTLVDNVPAAMLTFDHEDRIVAFNAAAEAMFGRCALQADSAAEDGVLASLLRGGFDDTAADMDRRAGFFRHRWARPDGSLIEVEVTAHQLARDRRARRVLLIQDVTRRNAAEAELRRSVVRLSTILQCAGEGICAIGARGQLSLINPAAVELLALPPCAGEANCTASDAAFESVSCVPEDHALGGLRAILDMTMASRGRHCGVLEVTADDGTVRSIEYASSPKFTDGGVVGAVIIFRDIGERQRADAALRFAERMLTRTQAIGMVGSWHVDLRSGSHHWSAEARRIIGVAPDQAADPALHLARVHPEDRERVDGLVKRALQMHVSHEVRYRLVVDGQTKWVCGRGEFEFDAQGQALIWAGSIQDITWLQGREEELLQSRQRIREMAARQEREREAERTRVAREVHDELAQQLTAMRMAVHVTETRAGLGHETLRSDLADLKHRIDETQLIVRGLVASLRPAALEHGLGPAVEWLVSEFRRNTGVDAILRLEGETLPCDDEICTVVFRTLQEALTNVARHAKARKVLIRVEVTPDALSLCVRDDGAGFDMTSVRAKQTYGLMGMRERALILGGSVRIESKLGAGTTVAVKLPLTARRDET